MMTPLQQIKEGILTEDFALIAQGYATLTGEVLEVTKSAPIIDPIEEAPQQQERGASRGYNLEDFNMQIVDKSRQKRDADDGRKSPIISPINVKKIQTVGNLFSDENKIALKDKAIDKKLAIQAPVERTREKVVKKLFKCQNFEKCHSADMLDPQFVPEGKHTCSKCVQKKLKDRQNG